MPVMRIIYFLLAGLLITAAPASAQIYVGGEVGLNVSSYTGKLGGKNKRAVRLGETAGFIFSKDITWHLSFMTGITYARNGYQVLKDGISYKVSINTFEVPLNLEYQIGLTKKQNYFVGGGPYVATNTHGRTSLSGPFPANQDLRVGLGAGDDIKRYDVGCSLWFVFQATKGLFFRARCQSGFFNLDPSKYSKGNEMRNQDFRLTVGYMFE